MTGSQKSNTRYTALKYRVLAVARRPPGHAGHAEQRRSFSPRSSSLRSSSVRRCSPAGPPCSRELLPLLFIFTYESSQDSARAGGKMRTSRRRVKDDTFHNTLTYKIKGESPHIQFAVNGYPESVDTLSCAPLHGRMFHPFQSTSQRTVNAHGN